MNAPARLNAVPVVNPNDRLEVSHEIRNIKDIKAVVDFLRPRSPDLTEEETILAKRALEAAARDEANGFPLHTRIDFHFGIYMTAFYSVWKFLGDIHLLRQSIVTVSVKTSDNYHVAFNRKMESADNRDYIGVVSGYCKKRVARHMAVGNYIRACALDELSDELDLSERDIAEFHFPAFVPRYHYQDVALVTVRLRLTKNDLLAARLRRPAPLGVLSSTESGFFCATDEEIMRLITDSRIRGVHHQLVGLLTPILLDGAHDRRRILNTVERIPSVEHDDVYISLSDLLDYYGIYDRTF